LTNALCGERLPAINLAHADLAGGEQGPEQHGSSFRRWQHRLRLDFALELLVQSLDFIRGAGKSSIDWAASG
jgi:hypothetical protein